MAAPKIRAIREGFGERLDTISGLRVHDTIVGSFSPPAALVGMPRRVETETMGQGTDRYEIDIWVAVARQLTERAEKDIEGYLNATGDQSVRAAIYGGTPAQSLGGVLGRGTIEELRAEVAPLAFGSGDNEVVYLGCEFRFQFLADGKD